MKSAFYSLLQRFKLLLLLALWLAGMQAAYAAFPAWTLPPDSQQPNQVEAEGVDTGMGYAMAFDTHNRPYMIHDRNDTVFPGKIRTLRNGLWTDIDYHTAFQAAYPNKTLTNHNQHFHWYWQIAIDDGNSLYAVVWDEGETKREEPLERKRLYSKPYLMYSPDITAASPTFSFYTFDADIKTVTIGLELYLSASADTSVPPAFSTYSYWRRSADGGRRSRMNIYGPTKDAVTKKLTFGDPVEVANVGVAALINKARAWAVTKNDKTHFTYLTDNQSLNGSEVAGTTNIWVGTLDRRSSTKRLPVNKFLSHTHGFGTADNHSFAVIGIDSNNIVHLMRGTHGEQFPYYKATTANSVATLMDQGASNKVPTDNVPVTYVDMIIDDINALHTSYRTFTDTADNPNIRDEEGPYMGVGYSRRTSSASTWEKQKLLIGADTGGTGFHPVPQQHLSLDRKSSGNKTLYQTSVDTYTGQAGAFTEYPIVVLRSEDNGVTWKLATRHDMLDDVNSGTHKKTTQRISLPPIPNKYTTDSSFTLSPTTDANGLTVTLEVVSGPATVSDNTVSLTGPTGEVVIKAKNAGDSTYYADEVIRKFQVDTATIKNLSQGKAAYQSTTDNKVLDAFNPASIAVDGVTSGSGLAQVTSTRNTNTVAPNGHKFDVQNSWWEVDLGSVASIDHIKIYNRTDCCASLLNNYYVFISDTPFTGKTIASSRNQSGVWEIHKTTQAGAPTTISGINRSGRYVRIQSNKDYTRLSLTEVQVFGTWVPPTTTPINMSRTRTNLAAGILPNPGGNMPARATDGVKTSLQFTDLDIGVKYLQLDLGQAFDINELKVWHYVDDDRTYNDVIFELSNDPTFPAGSRTRVFNNDNDGTAAGTLLGEAGSDAPYAETANGKSVTFDPVNARYVRLYTNGSSIDGYNHYVEVEVYGFR